MQIKVNDQLISILIDPWYLREPKAKLGVKRKFN